MKLIKCPKCGEMYSDSYKTCPFCQEDEALKGRSAAPHRKVTKHRRAPSILGPAMVLVVVLAAVLVRGLEHNHLQPVWVVVEAVEEFVILVEQYLLAIVVFLIPAHRLQRQTI